MNLSVAVHFLEDTEDEFEEIQLARRHLRDMYNVLEMPPNLFVANFRVSKDVFQMLLGKFQQNIGTFRSTRIRADVRLATFLRFVATGSYQQTVGNEVLSSTCKASVCRIIDECLNLFENIICGEWIKMPGPEEQITIKRAFFEARGFPGIIGCVDGTHIRIKSPGSNLKHLYYHRKGYYSINAMVICDHKTKILCVDATHPGANHDAFVWEQSHVDDKLQERYESGDRNTWILGDAGYKLKPFLMTPIRNPSDAAELRYNKKHCSARNVVERCFGILKNRFRCIIGSRGLHYSPAKTTKIMNACCALHNMCLHYKCPELEVVEVAEDTQGEQLEDMEDEVRAATIRRTIALSL